MIYPPDFTVLLCEADTPASIPLPHSPSVYLSKRCADSPEGRGLTRALVTEAAREWLAG